MQTIATLSKGERAIISKFSDSELSSKLIDMGCVPGEEIFLSNIAPLGCPIAINVQGYELSMRKDEAERVIVNKLN